jgi:lipopolysaccharide export system protein LptC
MTIKPLKVARPSERSLEPPRPRPAPSARGIASRRWLVLIAKRVLPVAALALLTSVALWPGLNKDATTARIVFGRGMVEPENGQLTQVRYNGVDEGGRPYTITADTARQVTPDRINLQAPIGDVTLGHDVWLHGKSREGVYMQQQGLLDLSGNVTLYRDDGITLQTDAATLDVKADAAASAAKVHAEGPFGTLDAQGFSMFEGGDIIQFHGPSRLVLNGSTRR